MNKIAFNLLYNTSWRYIVPLLKEVEERVVGSTVIAHRLQPFIFCYGDKCHHYLLNFCTCGLSACGAMRWWPRRGLGIADRQRIFGIRQMMQGGASGTTCPAADWSEEGFEDLLEDIVRRDAVEQVHAGLEFEDINAAAHDVVDVSLSLVLEQCE